MIEHFVMKNYSNDIRMSVKTNIVLKICYIKRVLVSQF